MNKHMSFGSWKTKNHYVSEEHESDRFRKEQEAGGLATTLLLPPHVQNNLPSRFCSLSLPFQPPSLLCCLLLGITHEGCAGHSACKTFQHRKPLPTGSLPEFLRTKILRKEPHCPTSSRVGMDRGSLGNIRICHLSSKDPHCLSQSSVAWSWGNNEGKG